MSNAMRSSRRPSSEQNPVDTTRSIEPGIITAIEPQKHARTRYSVFLDGNFAFGIGRDLLLESGIGKGDYLDRLRIDAILASDAIDRAVTVAMRALDQRLQTHRELALRLQRKGFALETTEAALERLTALGYLDDERFAERWIENRLEHRPRGKRLIALELRQKGIDRQIVEETVSGMDIDDRRAALELARKRARNWQSLPPDEQQKKLTGLLARRGFDYDTIRSTLKTLLDAEIDDAEMGDSEAGVV